MSAVLEADLLSPVVFLEIVDQIVMGHDTPFLAEDDVTLGIMALDVDGDATAAATKRLRDLPDDVDIDTLSHAVEALIIEAGVDGSDGFKRACDRLVIEHAREDMQRSRVWFKAMGFDHDPNALPGIDSLFEN